MIRRNPFWQIAPWIGALGLVGCSTSAGSYDFSTYGFTVSDGTQEVASACEHLPVLWGTERLTRHEIDAEFTILMHSNNREASVTFERIEQPAQAARHFTLQELEGSLSEEVTIQTEQGQSFDVVIASGCNPN